MKIDRKLFFEKIRMSLFHGELSSKQVIGIESIIDEFENRGASDMRHLAYMLATTYHETQQTMWPIEEYGKGKDRPYGVKLKMGKGPGKRVPYNTPNKIYYGRGFVQLTWYENYQSMGKVLGIDLLNEPELTLQPEISAKILYIGMTKGMFTGETLQKYFNSTKTEWVNARKIINGLDRANDIGGYAKKFYEALS